MADINSIQAGKSSIKSERQASDTFSSLKKTYLAFLKKMSFSDFANSDVRYTEELLMLCSLKLLAQKENLTSELKKIEEREIQIKDKFLKKPSDNMLVAYKPTFSGNNNGNQNNKAQLTEYIKTLPANLRQRAIQVISCYTTDECGISAKELLKLIKYPDTKFFEAVNLLSVKGREIPLSIEDIDLVLYQDTDKIENIYKRNLLTLKKSDNKQLHIDDVVRLASFYDNEFKNFVSRGFLEAKYYNSEGVFRNPALMNTCNLPDKMWNNFLQNLESTGYNGDLDNAKICFFTEANPQSALNASKRGILDMQELGLKTIHMLSDFSDEDYDKFSKRNILSYFPKYMEIDYNTVTNALKISDEEFETVENLYKDEEISSRREKLDLNNAINFVIKNPKNKDFYLQFIKSGNDKTEYTNKEISDILKIKEENIPFINPILDMIKGKNIDTQYLYLISEANESIRNKVIEYLSTFYPDTQNNLKHPLLYSYEISENDSRQMRFQYIKNSSPNSEFAYSPDDIKVFCFLPEETFEKAKKYINIQGRKEQFSAIEVNKLVNSSDEIQENLIKRKLIFPTENGYEFSFDTALIFSKIDDETYSKLKEKKFFEDILPQISDFKNKDLETLINLPDEDYDFIYSILTNCNSDFQISFDDINNFVNWYKNNDEYSIDKIFEIKRTVNTLLNHANDNLSPQIKQIYESLFNSKGTIKVNNDSIADFYKNFISNTNPITENILKTFDFASFKKQGLPLKYSRQEFLSDFTKSIDKFSMAEEKQIYKKIGIEPVIDKETSEITGYNGLITSENLDLKDTREKELADVINKFLLENEVITGNKETDKVFNSLIKGVPEFINIIGKQQHLTHAYSLDIHTFLVLQKVLNHPEYASLSNINKIALKFSALFHDISKAEATVDSNHPKKSAEYMKEISQKLHLPEAIADKCYELISNHHWMADYSNSKISVDELVKSFRFPQNYTMAKILGESDVKSINSSQMYFKTTETVDSRFTLIKDKLKEIYTSGIMIFPTISFNPNLFDKVEYKGKEYKVLDFNQIKDDTPLEKYGFLAGTKKEDVRFLVHMLPEEIIEESAKSISLLQDMRNTGVISCSFISPENSKTYSFRKFGLVINAENNNIASASNNNISSGKLKNENNFIQIINKNDSVKKYFANSFIKNCIENGIEISTDDYAELYKQISILKSLEQIKDNSEINVNGKQFNGKILKNIIKKTQDELITNCSQLNNEIVIYNPKISAAIAKVSSINQIPDEFLRFIHENDLPLYIIPNVKK